MPFCSGTWLYAENFDFNRIDTESVKLPAKITLGATDVPAAALTEQEALAQGPQ